MQIDRTVMRLTAFALLGLIAAAPAQAATVKVIVEVTELNKGMVNIALCDRDLSKEGCTFFQSAEPTQKLLEFTFENVPAGRWAAVGFQDMDGDDEFDRLLGVPREPYALSGKAADVLVPKFQDAALPIKDGTENVIRIKMQRLLPK
jgi:uncharacterized protein (DUF2141 family)